MAALNQAKMNYAATRQEVTSSRGYVSLGDRFLNQLGFLSGSQKLELEGLEIKADQLKARLKEGPSNADVVNELRMVQGSLERLTQNKKIGTIQSIYEQVKGAISEALGRVSKEPQDTKPAASEQAKPPLEKVKLAPPVGNDEHL